MVQSNFGDRTAPQSSSGDGIEISFRRGRHPWHAFLLSNSDLVRSLANGGRSLKVTVERLKNQCFEKTFSFLSTVYFQNFIRKCSVPDNGENNKGPYLNDVYTERGEGVLKMQMNADDGGRGG